MIELIRVFFAFLCAGFLILNSISKYFQLKKILKTLQAGLWLFYCPELNVNIGVVFY